MRSFVSKSKNTTKGKAQALNTSKTGRFIRLVVLFIKGLVKSIVWLTKTPLALVSVVLLVLFSWAVYKDVPQTLYFFVDSQMAKLAVEKDIQLKNVYLEGQEHTKTESILEVMDVKIGMPLFSVPLEEIRIRLEALPWVRYAEVERQYPSTITVRIVERIPVALWQVDQKLRLLDADAVVIDVDDIGAFSNYLILVGADAPYHLSEVMQILESQESLRPLVSSMVRVSERRWDVILRNDMRIMLPENKPEAMWSYLAQLHEEKNILSDSDIISINLKIPEKLFIEKKSGKEKGHTSDGGNHT